jgi:hypothetical protein
LINRHPAVATNGQRGDDRVEAICHGADANPHWRRAGVPG